ncbi:two-component system chemotaxis response regulator CheY [Microvirga flocculans]|uniref:Two-component system chemotaxis response regulator CheY n=1 Tax=Microvirga flocculans TaxID=217168 RepID=A0A7W6N8L6_9HYPH|nr:response regulator [Microvirga flocculans]MBB4040786.1 two-component system chemotaxis response regulator CheY [Microvirga flocculans]
MSYCLIIDDSRVIRKVSREMLEGMSFRVAEAENGEAGLLACRAEMPDLILLDWNMPVMDGFSFLTKLRATPEGQHPKVIFCTTENSLEHITRALDAGANEYIMKPFDRDILTAKLQELGVLPVSHTA